MRKHTRNKRFIPHDFQIGPIAAVVGCAPAIAHVGRRTTRLTVSRACTAAGGAKARVEGVVGMFTVCCALQAARRRIPSLSRAVWAPWVTFFGGAGVAFVFPKAGIFFLAGRI